MDTDDGSARRTRLRSLAGAGVARGQPGRSGRTNRRHVAQPVVPQAAIAGAGYIAPAPDPPVDRLRTVAEAGWMGAPDE